MKSSLITLGILTALTGTSAFANTGTINFVGKIDSSTCPIEVVNPGSGAVTNEVSMGSISPSRFTEVGQEYPGNDFILRIPLDSNCAVVNAGTVTFTSNAAGDNYATKAYTGAATGVAIIIKDHTGEAVKNGIESKPYVLDPLKVNDMKFDAYYVSTSKDVGAGPADADINFLVTIK